MAALKVATAEAQKGQLQSQVDAAIAANEKQATLHELDALKAKAAEEKAREAAVCEARAEERQAADAKYDELRVLTDAASAELQAQLSDLREQARQASERNAELEAAAAAAARARGGSAKRARLAGKKRAAPDDEVAAEFDDEPAPKRAKDKEPKEESPWAKFECATRAWSVASSGAKDFFDAIGVRSAADFGHRLASEAAWAAQLLASPELPADLEPALRVLTQQPYALDGQAYQSKNMLVARIGWASSLAITPETKEINVDGNEELGKHIFNQSKKAVNGVHQLVQAYNLWSQLLGPHPETYEPIAMTAKKETLRRNKPMAAMSAIRAKAGGFASIEAYEASLEAGAEAEAAEAAEAGAEVEAAEAGAEAEAAEAAEAIEAGAEAEAL